MIRVHRLGGEPIAVNFDHVERVELAPETLLVLRSGERLRVRESMDEVIAEMVRARRRTWAAPRLEGTDWESP